MAQRYLFFNLKHILITAFLVTKITVIAHAQLIMLDPAGHAKDTGRKLHQSYERAQTLACAQALKQKIENSSHIKVLLTRSPGDVIEPLQNAALANRMNVDLFLRIHCCIQNTEKPQMALFYLMYDTIIDAAKRTYNPHTFIPIHQAHFKNINQTIAWGNQLKDFLHHNNQQCFDIIGCYGIPLLPFVGITAPALMIEISLPTNDTEWEVIVNPLAQGIAYLLNNKIA